ncbi:MAG: hypothetical protein Q7R98_00255 [Candidatus Jorgensenbacteria bacterium]|nr:hypothetical protein [Candidatus Jorgensenbacteria bacterium]
MATFITELIAMVALAAVLYVLIQILPRINDAEVERVTSRLSFHGLVGRLEKVDEFIAAVFHKFLRRTRVVILKLDNVVGKKLNEMKKESIGKESPFQAEVEEEKKDQSV